MPLPSFSLLVIALFNTLAINLISTQRVTSFQTPSPSLSTSFHKNYHYGKSNDILKMKASSSSSTSQNSHAKTNKRIVIVGVTCQNDKDASPILKEGVTDLFKLYFDELYELGCDLGFQGFQSEWIDLPGKYDFEKRGGLFVAVELDGSDRDCDNNVSRSNGVGVDVDVFVGRPGMDLKFNDNKPFEKKTLNDLLQDKNQVVGCIAIRSLAENCGEVKRMYIRKSHRRLGLGKLLAKQIIDHAWDECKYEEIKLDSLERLQAAVTLYENMGFQKIPPYCECPEADHVCMNLFRQA